MTELLNPLEYTAHLNKVIFKQSVPPPHTHKILRQMIFRDMKAVRFVNKLYKQLAEFMYVKTEVHMAIAVL
jgi:hypothetical protein